MHFVFPVRASGTRPPENRPVNGSCWRRASRSSPDNFHRTSRCHCSPRVAAIGVGAATSGPPPAPLPQAAAEQHPATKAAAFRQDQVVQGQGQGTRFTQTGQMKRGHLLMTMGESPLFFASFPCSEKVMKSILQSLSHNRTL